MTAPRNAESLTPATLGGSATPAVVVDRTALRANLAAMANCLPGARLRPHVKAHKCSEIAREQVRQGHPGITCATPLEATGIVTAGVSTDILVANEVLEPGRLRALASLQDRATIMIAVDSDDTVRAAVAAGLRDVVVDVDIGLPRCGCDPGDAGRLADVARRLGLVVHGVMGYEGHLMMNVADDVKRRRFETAMTRLSSAHAAVGGTIVSSGGTGTHHLHAAGSPATEVQAGSYALMDTAYAADPHPFVPAMVVLGTVISTPRRPPLDHVVVDVGLKALTIDHGNPVVPCADVRFLSDEHATVTPSGGTGSRRFAIGDRVAVVPSHIDPTMTLHADALVVDGPAGRTLDQLETDELAALPVIDRWAIDLRGW
jgi:D-threonine aldolase